MKDIKGWMSKDVLIEGFLGMKPEQWIDGTDFWVEGYGG